MSGQEDVDHLSVDDLLEIADGVLGSFVVRDLGLLPSAAARAAATAFGDDAYPTFVAKCSALVHSLARNRALVDGNKRLAWSAARAFCLLNGHDLRYEVDDAEQFVLAVASGDPDVVEIARWIGAHLIDG